MKKLFGGINLTYKKIILLSIIFGIYTGIMALIPNIKDTSFIDITISFEVWIFLGIIIIMNSDSAISSAKKCFIFFLISQPLVYLIQVPFKNMGWEIFSFYKTWFIWTILTIPMGYIGYYMKKNKWYSLVILFPMLLFLGVHYSKFLGEVIFKFPHHLLSTIFSFVTLYFYALFIFDNKKLKNFTIIITTCIVLVATIASFLNKISYNTYILISDDEFAFDLSYTAELKSKKFGDVSIKYNEDLGTYLVEANFKKGGNTNLIVKDKDGNETIFDLEIDYNSYNLKKR